VLITLAEIDGDARLWSGIDIGIVTEASETVAVDKINHTVMPAKGITVTCHLHRHLRN